MKKKSTSDKVAQKLQLVRPNASRLLGETALVTGASRGIGRSIALAFARAGADLAISARGTTELEVLATEIRSLGRRCVVIVSDLLEPKAAVNLYQQTKKQLGPISVLVNNAGIGSSAGPSPAVAFSEKLWNETLHVNLTIPFQLSKAVLPEMIARSHGRIINIASINGKIPLMHGTAYSVSKHGLIGLTRNLALETVVNGITVNAICPGPVRSTISDARIIYEANRLGKSPDEIEGQMTPLGRRLDPEEIAPLAVYLASGEAAAITGQAVNIDGGFLIAG